MGSSNDLPALEGPRGPGCLRGAVGTLALVVLGPPVAGLRVLRRWRRGERIEAAWTGEAFPLSSGAGLARLDLCLDAPLASERAVADRLTETVVRVAERVHPRGAVVHAVFRRAGDSQPVLAPVGPQLHDLGERFALLVAHQRLERRTVVWLALPAGVHLASVVDPGSYDPEQVGEPDALVRTITPEWAAASSFARGPASLAYRLVLYVPQRAERDVEGVLERLCTAFDQ